jgi:hypothetical protein
LRISSSCKKIRGGRGKTNTSWYFTKLICQSLVEMGFISNYTEGNIDSEEGQNE